MIPLAELLISHVFSCVLECLGQLEQATQQQSTGSASDIHPSSATPFPEPPFKLTYDEYSAEFTFSLTFGMNGMMLGGGML